MLCEFIPFKMLPFLIIILLTLAQNGLMVSKQQSLSNNGVNLISSTQLIPFEIDVPEHLEALGSRLTVKIRRSLHPLSLNATTSGRRREFWESEIKPRETYLQLGMYETDGKAVMLTQEKITETISANWQQVSFDCGWIVKGGNYFVYLIHYPNEHDGGDTQPSSSEYSSESMYEFSGDSSEQNSRASTFLSSSYQTTNEDGDDLHFLSSHFSHKRVNNQVSTSFHNKSNVNVKSKLEYEHPTTDIGGSRLRLLAKKTFHVKSPTILFEVPTRLETYTTSAPVTFGLTRTICKPKLRLPSTVLTLTMCSFAASEQSGPSSDHFSSNHIVPTTTDENGMGNPRRSGNMKHTNKLVSSSPNQLFSYGGSGANQPHHHHHHHYRDHRRNNPEHHSSSKALPQAQIQRISNRRHNVTTTDDAPYNNVKTEIKNKLECRRDVATIFHEPLRALQTEGRVTINVDCQLWGRNATYVIQLREANSPSIIAQSSFIKVEWSSQFSLDVSKRSILRCQKSISTPVSHPQCILPGRDKIRVYGHETLPVPSLLAPKRVSYIGEKQIPVDDDKPLEFPCSMFPSRFLRFCFQYVNTAVDESVAVVMEKCIPTGPANKIADGGWSAWSKWSSCSVTCGAGGKRFRYRFCDTPPPTSGANFCQGKAIQEEPCDSGIPCPQIPLRRPSHPTQNGVKKGYVEQSTISPGEVDHQDAENKRMRHFGGSNRPSFMDFSVFNVSTTPGCECGCILYDLVPTKNYSLVIIISANQSSCADEDEEDHHNFRWILHARNQDDRIRLDIVGMDVQCVTMTFRDGNTTDSNLLEVITASQPSDPIQFEGIYEKQMGQRNIPSPSYQPSYPYDEDEDDIEDEDESIEDEHGGEDNLYDKGESEDESTDDIMNTKGSTSILRIESTGPSLSIGTTSDATKNCSGQFIYFIAYYTTISSPSAGVEEGKEKVAGYEFWTFLIVKIMILCFVAIVVCSTFGGCITKVYRKYKYKELKCFENDDEEGSLNDEGNEVRKSRRGTLDDASRCTSITLMSFDYSYWRRLRILRLKYFLLRPRPLDPVTTKIKSFPNTPTASKKIKENASTSAGRNNNVRTTFTSNATASGDEPISKMQTCTGNDHHNPSVLNKPISRSETNLREKSAVLAVTKNGYELRRARNKNGKITTKKNDVDYGEERNSSTVSRVGLSGAYPKQGTNSVEHGSVSDMYGGYGNVSLTSTSVSISMSQSLNGSETASSNSITTPTPTPSLHDKKSNKREENKLRSGGIKLLKEQENLKRKAGEKNENVSGREDAHYLEGASSMTPPRSLSSSENSHRGILKKRIFRPNGSEARGKGKMKRNLKHGESSASVSTIQSACLSSTCEDDSSRVASRAGLEDTDQDFEMDYYDYDVMNAGNIPGSYLGLEPAFVLWNSEVYPHSDEDESAVGGVDDGRDKSKDSVEILHPLAKETHGGMEDSAYGIEMTPSSSSIGMLSSDVSPRKEIGVEETSLDTLKFADEDDDDDDELESFAESVDDSIQMKSMKDSGYSGRPSITKKPSNISYYLGKS